MPGTNHAPPADPLPLFPLQMVLFPGAVLGLKVFEARYIDLVGRCLLSGEPFGVVCLRQGREAGRAAGPVRLEEVGVLARIAEVDSEQQGILRVRCSGTQRFRRTGEPRQLDDGLWVSATVAVPEDPSRLPGPAMFQTVRALSKAIQSLRDQGSMPFAEPFRLDDAGWVANRWCELLPVSLAAKQKLMELEDPVIRLSLVDGFLRDKQVVRD
jgi:Lon protease-like protein